MRTFTAKITLALMSAKLLAAASMLAGGLLLTACHTVEGAGRDVQAVGGGVEDTADRARPYE